MQLNTAFCLEERKCNSVRLTHSQTHCRMSDDKFNTWTALYYIKLCQDIIAIFLDNDYEKHYKKHDAVFFTKIDPPRFPANPGVNISHPDPIKSQTFDSFTHLISYTSVSDFIHSLCLSNQLNHACLLIFLAHTVCCLCGFIDSS